MICSVDKSSDILHTRILNIYFLKYFLEQEMELLLIKLKHIK